MKKRISLLLAIIIAISSIFVACSASKKETEAGLDSQANE